MLTIFVRKYTDFCFASTKPSRKKISSKKGDASSLELRSPCSQIFLEKNCNVTCSANIHLLRLISKALLNLVNLNQVGLGHNYRTINCMVSSLTNEHFHSLRTWLHEGRNFFIQKYYLPCFSRMSPRSVLHPPVSQPMAHLLHYSSRRGWS